VIIHRLDDFFHLPPGADIAGVDTDTIDDLRGFQGKAMIEVDIGDQRHRHGRFNLR
jgi:hypothetical protein